MKDRPALPDWPALMDQDLARLYCGGLGQEAFVGLTARYGVRPLDLGVARVRYRKADLDGMIDRLPARGAELDDPEPQRVEAAVTEADAALDRVRRRARAGRGG